MQRLAIGRMHRGRHQHALRSGAAGAFGHQHRFGQRGRAVVHRRIRHIHAGQPRHHRLVFVDQLQRALAGFGLVRRVRRIKLTATNDLPDRRRDVVFVGAGAGEIEFDRIHPRAFAQHPVGFHLAQARRHSVQRLDLQRGGNLVEQILDAVRADRSEHGGNVGVGVRNEGHGVLPGIGNGESSEARTADHGMQDNRFGQRRTEVKVRFHNSLFPTPIPGFNAPHPRSSSRNRPGRAFRPSRPCRRAGSRISSPRRRRPR